MAFYTKLAHLRKLYAVLRQGAFVTLLTGDTQQPNTAPNTYAFARTMQGLDPVVVALNNGPASNSASIPMTGLFTDGTLLYDVLGGGTYTVGAGAVQVTLPARTGVFLDSRSGSQQRADSIRSHHPQSRDERQRLDEFSRDRSPARKRQRQRNRAASLLD